MKKPVLIFIVAAIVAGVGALALSALGKPPIIQPIQFNHKLHTQDVGLDCIECHQFYKTQQFSGLPGVDICLGCHEEALTKSPEEEKIRKIKAAGGQIEWKRIYNIENHVFYSHRRHVVLAGLQCVNCHGEIDKTTSPPTAPLKKIDMDFCLDCHRKNKYPITEDCIACHK